MSRSRIAERDENPLPAPPPRGDPLPGSIRAFRPADASQLTGAVTTTSGVFSLATGLLFVVAFIPLLLKTRVWRVIRAVGAISAQIPIIQSRSDARYGTIAHVTILVPTPVSFLNALPSSYTGGLSFHLPQPWNPRAVHPAAFPLRNRR